MALVRSHDAHDRNTSPGAGHSCLMEVGCLPAPAEGVSFVARAGDFGPGCPAVFDLVPQIVWVFRADGSCERFNRSWRRFAGDHGDRILDCDWLQWAHAEDRAGALRAWTRFRRTRAAVDIECRLRNAAGDYRWFLVTTILCVSREVTLQREAERRLRKAGEVDALTGLHNRKSAISSWRPAVRLARACCSAPN